MATTRRQQRFAGHTKHTHYCSCGRQVSGNGGLRHFEKAGHQRITQTVWRERFASAPAVMTDAERRVLRALWTSDAGVWFLSVVLSEYTQSQLRTTLRDLEHRELVTTTAPHGAYSITDAGREALAAWIAERDRAGR
jgi:hypothetical protein